MPRRPRDRRNLPALDAPKKPTAPPTELFVGYVVGGLILVNNRASLYGVNVRSDGTPNLKPPPSEPVDVTNQLPRMTRWRTRQAARAWLGYRPKLAGMRVLDVAALAIRVPDTDPIPPI